MQFFNAGIETTGTTLAFALYEFCINSAVQEKARAEIEKIVPNIEEVSYESLNELKYLGLCISGEPTKDNYNAEWFYVFFPLNIMFPASFPSSISQCIILNNWKIK